MAWLESHQTLKDHPKTLRASRILGISRQQLVGHLMFLWWWALDYAQDGDLSAFASEEIESVMGWGGEPDALYNALINCRIDDNRAGFIEKVGNKVFIHDWDEYAGKLIDRRREDAERKRQERRSKSPIPSEDIPEDVLLESTGHPSDVHTPSLVENTTQHNTTQQDTINNAGNSAPASSYSPEENKPEKHKSQRAIVLSELEKEFSRISGLPLPARRTADEKKASAKRWWNPLWQIYDVTAGADLERAKSAMQTTVTKMRRDKLTITAPQSIVNICAAVVASDNGSSASHAPSHNGSNDPNYADLEYLRLNPKGRGRQDAIERLKARGYDVAHLSA